MSVDPQQVINKLIPRWKQLYHKYKSLRGIPFRKQFFIGYDLLGNTYWEFKLENHVQHLRRKLVPTSRKPYLFDYYSTVPPQWHQWLRFTREKAPSVQELLQDQERLRVLKLNSAIIDKNWKSLQRQQDELQDWNLQKELNKIDDEIEKARR